MSMHLPLFDHMCMLKVPSVVRRLLIEMMIGMMVCVLRLRMMSLVVVRSNMFVVAFPNVTIGVNSVS